MDTELGFWQARLTRHFTELHHHRNSEAANRPIYALEHDLNLSEVEKLATAVRSYVAEYPPSLEHALAWIVYSAEIGYRYSGDEYWQTFEQETPGWTAIGDRYWIRRCYHLFQKQFGGAKPSGAWAEHFSIICWPITHAILPRDLQRQLAYILYNLRHSFSAELFESPSILGESIAAQSWNATSRFQNFAQETQLVGQIAAALLLHGEFDTGSFIYPATLKRISEDLDRERKARDWLHGARRLAKERSRIRNPVLISSTTAPTIRHPDEARAEVARLGIEPRLVLRPKELAGTSWEVRLEIPDLSKLLIRFPKTRDILTGSRCVVAGASGSPRARTFFLHGSQQVELSKWPQSDEVLLRFEQAEPQLEFLLRTECLLRPGPIWLFKIASDGLAYELRSLRIRPGEQYLIVSTSELVKLTDHIRSVDLACEGVKGAILDLPPALTSDLEEMLRSLGLGQEKTTEVWPTGLAPVRWDGEGVMEWLSTEKLRLGLRADHHVTSFSVEVDLYKVDVPASSTGAPVFIEFPQLSPGVYTVHINALSGDGVVSESGSLKLHINIREPRSWSPGNSNGGAILVIVEPTTPTLEQLWESKIELQVQGPASRKVLCSIAFFERGKGQHLVKKELPPISLPIDTTMWRKHFDQHFKNQKDVQNTYDLAQTCRVSIASGELGTFTLTVEREFSPLGWVVRWNKDGFLLRVLDNTGAEMTQQVVQYEFSSPDVMKPLDTGVFNHPEGTKVSSGLYVARIGKYQSSVVIAPNEMHSFEDFRLEPRVSCWKRAPEDILELVRIVDSWACARLTGNITSLYWWRKVQLALVQEVFSLIGGNNWAEGEKALQQSGKPLLQCIETFLKKQNEIEFAKKILYNVQKYGLTPKKRAQNLAVFSSLYLHLLIPESACVGVTGDTDSRLLWLSELALRLASGSRGTVIWAGEKLYQGISYLLGEPSLARVARVVVLALDQTSDKAGFRSDLYEGWSWE